MNPKIDADAVLKPGVIIAFRKEFTYTEHFNSSGMAAMPEVSTGSNKGDNDNRLLCSITGSTDLTDVSQLPREIKIAAHQRFKVTESSGVSSMAIKLKALDDLTFKGTIDCQVTRDGFSGFTYPKVSEFLKGFDVTRS